VSVPVALDKLRGEVDRFGASPYVITVSDDGRPHAVTVTVAWDGDRLAAGAGRTTSANAGDRPLVSMLWPPYEPDGYSLIVDGTASIDADRLLLLPARAVLHRPKAGPGMDCVTVL
jgi:hypothetical protein